MVSGSLGIWIVLAGATIGMLYGLFGVGSAFATPVLSMLGVTGMAAVVGPLPALLPSSAVGAWSYARRGKVDWWLVRTVVLAGLPATIAGALVSHFVGGPVLLALSGVVLLLVGLRVLRPGSPVERAVADRLRRRTGFVSAMAAAVGFSAGLLANGGGFLLVPLFLLVLGLEMNEATGTSLLIATSFTVPTLATHLLVGDIDWAVAGWFALGVVPAAAIGARLAQHLPAARLRGAFGVLLVVFAAWFLARQVGAVL